MENCNTTEKKDRAAYLILEDGTVYRGKGFGAEGTTIGEVVFTTGMTGYQETLTDPSYYGQIVTQTFPLIGNYGLNEFDGESAKAWAKGYIVREWCEEPSNFRSKYTLEEFLKMNNVIGIYDIDTRALTKKIREHGVMNGAIASELPVNMDAFLKELKAYVIRDAVKSVSCKEKTFYPAEDEKYRVVLYDYGFKANILRSLLQRGCSVTVVPYNTTAAEIRELGPDGIMLSNGPGDPSENIEPIKILNELMNTGIPIFGICLGHQLLALANGAKTEKLKYGHRGANQTRFRQAPGQGIHHQSESRLRCCGRDPGSEDWLREPLQRERRKLRRDHLRQREGLYRAVPSGGLRRAPGHPVSFR